MLVLVLVLILVLVLMLVLVLVLVASLKHPEMSKMFPLNDAQNFNTRYREKYKVTQASTGRLKNSAIPFMQRLLNAEDQKKYKK